MKATDEAIRQIEADLIKISKSVALQKIGVVINTGVGVLCQCATSEHLKDIGKLFAGGNLVSSALKYFQLNADKSAILEKTPFYFPWLIHREALKLAPK
jgi:3,4-dihydroxy-2-butanone 4-phosphate synthase